MGKVTPLSCDKHLTVKTNSVIDSSHPGRIILEQVTQVKNHINKPDQDGINNIRLQICTLNEASSSSEARVSLVCKLGNICSSGAIVFSALYIIPDAKKIDVFFVKPIPLSIRPT
jgi:hypothetical protein